MQKNSFHIREHDIIGLSVHYFVEYKHLKVGD